MTVHVFSGPSTAGSALLEMPEVCPHPPVTHGDLYRLRLEPGDTVLIIDGLYQHEPPVRHKEILSLCASGVRVYGAASIGALRASEMHSLGMPGLGTVFGWYRDGRLNSDADVAVVHGDADIGFRAFTHAMVSILDRCEELQRSRQLDAQAAAAVTHIARSVHFTERSSTALLVAARKHGQESAMRTVVTALADADSDIKRRDAATAIRALVEAGPVPLRDQEIAEVPDSSLRREWKLRHSPATDVADAPTMRRGAGLRAVLPTGLSGAAHALRPRAPCSRVSVPDRGPAFPALAHRAVISGTGAPRPAELRRRSGSCHQQKGSCGYSSGPSGSRPAGWYTTTSRPTWPATCPTSPRNAPACSRSPGRP